MSVIEAVLVLAAGLVFIRVLCRLGYVGRDVALRRAVARRERLRAEVELQRLTHLAVLGMLAAARQKYGQER